MLNLYLCPRKRKIDKQTNFVINIVINIIGNFLIKVFSLMVVRNRLKHILYYVRIIQCDFDLCYLTQITYINVWDKRSTAVKYKKNI